MELLAVFAPLAAFVVVGLFGRLMGDLLAQMVTCAGVILAAAASVYLFQDVVLLHQPRVLMLADWITSGDFKATWSLRVDQLTVVMMCVINIVSACVHVYSIGYMSHDKSIPRFMAYLSLFTFAMLMLVTSDNLLQLFFGWEGVGLASYLLIGFWHHKNSANAASVKAFIVNRVGDLGLMLGLLTCFIVFGSISYASIFEQVPDKANVFFNFLGVPVHALTLIGLLLFVGAVGKSAQLGLHTWLPDAMEGPTPVSALIHAATMVTAGVFLVARFSPLYEYAPDALMVICIVGACTALVAATIGLTQFDIKRVIAYSTMSQLGYMFFALGVSAYGAAMFHLVTHAFFKALLFLGAGAVIHALGDEQDMRKMGGLRKKIPFTHAVMFIGTLALCGVFPFAGFYSKDVILESAWASGTPWGQFAYYVGVSGAFITAFYSWRLMALTFYGATRADPHAYDHAHECPTVMKLPLLVLAIGAIGAGYYFAAGMVDAETGMHATPVAHEAQVETEATPLSFANYTEWSRAAFWGESLQVIHAHDSIAAAHHVPKWVKMVIMAAVFGGIGLSLLFYIVVTGAPAAVARAFRPLHTLFFRKWYFDELYDALFVKNAERLGRLFWIGGDQRIIDDCGPNALARISVVFAGGLTRLQTGFVYHYAFVMMLAVISLMTWVSWKMALFG